MMQDQLARGASELEVVSIVGMGGIGKTTLANKIYSDPFIMSHFDMHAKVTVSQGYCARVVLLCPLSCLSGKTDEFHEQQDDGQLADRLQKLLKGRRYLVVIDDIWTKGAWDDIKLCLPDSNCGSRILLTTRDMEVAEYASSCKPPYRMRLKNFDECWSLLCEKVFAKGFFPPEFEQLGKQIALKCKGLPLAIVVIAGLLSKIGKTLNEWKGVAENVSSMVSTDLDAHCLRVLALKGFLKVDETKSIKEVAEKCLKDLIDRSLVSVHHLSFDGKIKSCGIHDVTREFCLKEARNINFLNDNGGGNDQTTPCPQYRGFEPELVRFKLVRVLDLALLRCFTFPSWILDLIHLSYLALTLSPRAQSYLGEEISSSLVIPLWKQQLAEMQGKAAYNRSLWSGPSPDPAHSGSLVHRAAIILDIPLSISSLHYLQTFILKVSHHEVSQYPFILPSSILTMPQLSHLCLDWNYLRYHEPTERNLVLKNLQSLSGWNPLFCTWSVFRLLPSLKKLQICGIGKDFRRSKDILYFRYLDQLEELEFHIATPQDLPPTDHFPSCVYICNENFELIHIVLTLFLSYQIAVEVENRTIAQYYNKMQEDN
ncbi:hypothetical protein RND71_036509 [Anisodus tanguticus]|uniref:Uncharacterized protein n=1 Tax=Anisodus tanguticus TaxID=243964 RepID=A0AAE1R138_9SOLA|nr:hypothetical protein RND71_036509 [Anisodus tanguticus]